MDRTSRRALLLVAVCVAVLTVLLGPAVAARASAGPAIITPHGKIFSGKPDCQWPDLSIHLLHQQHPRPRTFVTGHGFLTCSARPDTLSSFMTYQQSGKGHWQLRHVTRTKKGVRPAGPDRWVLTIVVPPQHCAIGRFRVNWYSIGRSSTGDLDDGSFCSPVLKITSCGSHGEDVIKSGSHKRGCPPPLTT